MAPRHSASTLLAFSVVEDELCCPRTDCWKVDLILAFFAHQPDLPLAVLAVHRTSDLKPFVNLLRTRPTRSLTIALSGFPARSQRIALRLSLGERRRLPLAAASQLLVDLLQVHDATLQLPELLAELRVLLKKFLVSRHSQRELGHVLQKIASPYPQLQANSSTCPSGCRQR
jgi:hypothetical protein